MVRSGRKIHNLTNPRPSNQINPTQSPKLNQKLTQPNQSTRLPNPTSLLNLAPLACKGNQVFLSLILSPHLIRSISKVVLHFRTIYHHFSHSFNFLDLSLETQ